jgi:predicted Zn finger-like uncharacterized protein
MKITCPNCNRKLNVKAEAVGRRARCSSCQHVFTVQAAWGEPAAVNESSRPEPSEKPRREAPGPEEVLQAYKESSKRAAGPVKEELKGVFQKVKTRARTIKLKRHVAKLGSALDDQLERLGLLAIQHRPKQLDLTADLQELREVQQEISDHEATLESLGETRGSGSVVKDLKTEVVELRERERGLMIGIGRNAEEARPEMPGAGGHYSAIDRLRSTLESTEGELAELGHVVPPLPSQPVPEGRFARPKLLSFGVVVAVVVAGLVVVGLLALPSLFFTREPYQVDYQVADYHGSVCMEVKVAGPAADLAVLLTEPAGNTDTETIDKVDMMDNSETVRLNMLHDYKSILPGTYTLVVKTMEPERVVHKERVELKEGEVAIQAVRFQLKPWYGGKQLIEQVELTVQNTGHLPVRFGELSIDVGAILCTGRVTRAGLPGKQSVECPSLWCRPKKVDEYVPGSFRLPDISGSLEPGTYTARGKLEVAGKEGQFITFEEKLTVPRSQY